MSKLFAATLSTLDEVTQPEHRSGHYPQMRSAAVIEELVQRKVVVSFAQAGMQRGPNPNDSQRDQYVLVSEHPG